MRLLKPLETGPSIRWLDRRLAIGIPEPMDGWRRLRTQGVHAVVDLNEECSAVGAMVREQGTRYLRLSINSAGLPEVEELHIVTSWVLQRSREAGSVLIHDASVRGNDALVACAVLIKDGAALERALARLRGISEAPLSESQLSLLHQFVAQQTLATNRR